MNAGPKHRSARSTARARDTRAGDILTGTTGPTGMLGEPYFLVAELPAPGPFVLTAPRAGMPPRCAGCGSASLVLTDGPGGQAAAVVTEVGRGELTVDVASRATLPPPAVRVTLVQAVPKGDRGELAVELATEAGVDGVVPWAADRCVARWKTADQAAKAVERWRAAAREAAKQSRRPFVPPVADVASTADGRRADRAVGGRAGPARRGDVSRCGPRHCPTPVTWY